MSNHHLLYPHSLNHPHPPKSFSHSPLWKSSLHYRGLTFDVIIKTDALLVHVLEELESLATGGRYIMSYRPPHTLRFIESELLQSPQFLLLTTYPSDRPATSGLWHIRWGVSSPSSYSAFRQKLPKLWTVVAHSFLQQHAQNESWAHPKATTLPRIYKVETEHAPLLFYSALLLFYYKNWNYAFKLKIDTPKINWG